MGTLVLDAGSRYIVKNENLEAAYRWLEKEGEFALVIGNGEGVTYLGADGNEEMFCGNMSYGFTEDVRRFMELFCENKSFACFKYPDDFTYAICWKDNGVVYWDFEEWDNPFYEKIRELAGDLPWS